MDRRRATVVQVVALVCALALSGYLTYIKSQGKLPPCQVGGGCAAALYSKWGKLAGIPLAYIGFTASWVLLALAIWANPWVRLLSFTLLLIGTAFTIYLRYVEQAYLDHHICQWCVMFAISWWFATGAEIRRYLRPTGASPGLADAAQAT